MKNFPRKVVICLSQDKGGFKLIEIARYFGMKNYGGVASAICVVRRAMDAGQKVVKDINNIVKRLDPCSCSSQGLLRFLRK